LGSDHRRVQLLGAAFAEGLNDGGVVATFKHFPGLGAARTTTDYGRTTIDLPRVAIRQVDERPFSTATRGTRRMIMVSTAIYSSLSPEPAALSPTVVQTELREVIDFHGVSITDNLDSPAMRGVGTPTERAIRATRAGVDLVLFSRSYWAAARAADALEAAVRVGRFNRRELAEGSERVLVLRKQLGPR
jgi:beta-N-acetylhexosaminidase